MTIEKRVQASNIEVRTNKTDENLTVSGYAIRYNEESQPLEYGFKEIIRPNAFAESLNTRNIVALYQHDSKELLASTKANTLRLEDREDGIYFEMDLLEERKELLSLIRRKDLSNMSFGFACEEDKFTRNGDTDIREVMKGTLYEVSLVHSPAYETTTVVAQRSIDKYKEFKGDKKMTNQTQQTFNARDYIPGSASTEPEAQTEYREFLETREAIKGVTSNNGYFPVPTEEIQEIKKLKENEFQLKDLVNVRNVSRGEGTLPIVRANAEPMATVEELEQNPHLAITPFSQVPFKIDTYRTSLPISREIIEDAEIDIQKEVREYFKKLSIATENNEILDVLLNGSNEQTFETATASGADDIKSIINLNIAPNYSPTVVVNQTSYNEMSKWKDNNGRYMMHELPESQAKTFLGFDLVIVPNKLMEGNKIIVGDFKEAITFFDRSQYEVAYDMFENFGLGLMVAIRFDVKVVDTDALVIIDLTEEGA